MANRFLNVGEFLEQRRIEGCEFAPELLELWHSEYEIQSNRDTLNDLADLAPAMVNGSPLNGDQGRLYTWIKMRLDLLMVIETLIDDNSDGMAWPNGTMPVDLKGRLEVILETKQKG